MKKLLSKLLKTSLITLSCVYMFCMPAYADTPTFSEYWYQDGAGNWHIRDGNGNMVRNAWLCDDAVPSNGQDIWYLIDSNGNMVSAGLVQDQTGNIYSLETSHNGYYGMLRYKSGAYDGVYLDLESSHGGSFANIKNAEGRSGLQAIYGLTQVNIDNSNCIYTSSFRNSGGSYNGGSNSSNGVADSSQNTQTNTENTNPYRTPTLDELAAIADGNSSGFDPGESAGIEWHWH